MIVSIVASKEFSRQAKRLAKKYKSFVSDFSLFKMSIESNPYQGTDLGGGKRKIRMAVASKGKGKSGGVRVITFNVEYVEPEEVIVHLITIYDKQEMANVSEAYIDQIIRGLE